MIEDRYISQERLKQLLRYDPCTGVLYWKRRPESDFADASAAKTWNRRFSGHKAGCESGYGYLKIGIAGVKYQAHQLVWVLHTGEWPEEVDHINHDRADNRLENLRAVTRAENSRNQSRSTRNTSGEIGISWCAPSGKWRVRLRAGGSTRQIGMFAEMSDAVAARDAAKTRLGFHQNHGA